MLALQESIRPSADLIITVIFQGSVRKTRRRSLLQLMAEEIP